LKGSHPVILKKNTSASFGGCALLAASYYYKPIEKQYHKPGRQALLAFAVAGVNQHS